MILMNPKRFVNAAAKARSRNNKLFVRMFAWRQYQCRTQAGHVYTIRFETKASGVYAHCNCAAGAKKLPCYHVASAYPLDVAVVTTRMEQVKKKEVKWQERHPIVAAHLLKPQPASLGRMGGIEL